MQEQLRQRWALPALTAAGIIVADQFSKAWITRTLGTTEGASIPVLGSWLNLTLVHNTGVAFGMFQNVPYFFTITSVLISIGALLFYRYQLPHDRPLVQASVGMIVGGGIGNLIDRVRLGYVIDFVHVTWFPGIFNLADSAITIGVILLAGYLLLVGDREQRKEHSPRRTPNDDALLGDLLNNDQWAQRGDRQ